MSKAEYNFNHNLLKASFSKSLQEAKREWFEIYQEERINKDGLCICQRNNLKIIKYFYNIKTKNTIIVGSRCCKKFDFIVDKFKNKILEDLFKNIIIKGEYQVIDNIVEYTISVEEQLIEYFKKYTITKNIPILKKITEDIKKIIDDYNFNYLNDIYNTLTNLIKLREKEEQEEEKINKRKQLIYEERVNKDGKTYWYDLHNHISFYINPYKLTNK
jgi:hypothetical protein